MLICIATGVEWIWHEVDYHDQISTLANVVIIDHLLTSLRLIISVKYSRKLSPVKNESFQLHVGDIKVSKKRNYMEHAGYGANGSTSDKAPGQVSAARTLEILEKMLKQHTDALKIFKEEEMKFEFSCKQLTEIISNLESKNSITCGSFT